jgi:hypothetical protein
MVFRSLLSLFLFLFHFIFIVVSSMQFGSVALAGAAPGQKSKAPPGKGNVLVGAASRSVLPLVDGSLDYLKAGFRDRGDPNDPGILVPAWDDGRIAVGNGDSVFYWVHDDLRTTAVAIQDPRSGISGERSLSVSSWPLPRCGCSNPLK